MRLLLSHIFALTVAFGFAACSPAGQYDVAVEDDRFDLLRFNMPDLLASDAKRCVAGAPLLRGQGGAQDSVPEYLFEKVLDLWQVVDVTMLSVGNPADVLPAGGNPEGLASIFPKIKLPNAVANACGEYAGEVAVEIGLLSLSDMIDVALKENPEAFEDLGTSSEVVLEGVAIIEAQAAALNEVGVADQVHCLAIYQSAVVSNVELAPYRTVWLESLLRFIESGDVDPSELREKSVFWQTMAESGVDAVIEMDGFQNQAEKCDEWINMAMETQAAAQ